ncbi:MAG: hypothetical protein IJA84_06130 [Clostridia bacterium]|nr:hypothetical protein [Clostridia bacterium]
MKKRDFFSLLLGAVGGVLFGLGMCMCLLEEWNAFRPGVILGCAGLAVLVILVIVRRKMAGKPAVAINGRILGKVLFAALGALTLGVGMCMVMVWEGLLIPGVLVGLVGIILLLCLIPLCKGLH